MTRLTEQTIENEPDADDTTITPADAADVELVLGQDENSSDGRSNWVWVTLPNGDVVLGVFPQGATYEQIEHHVR